MKQIAQVAPTRRPVPAATTRLVPRLPACRSAEPRCRGAACAGRFVEVDASDESCQPAGDTNGRPRGDYGERMRQCEVTARQVLAARRLFELAGDQQAAFLLLDAVLIANEGEHAHEQAAERH